MRKQNTQQIAEPEISAGLNAVSHSDLNRVEKVSFIYLISVPFLTFLLGFGIGHVDWQLYLPVWLINILMMTLAMRQLLRSRLSGNPLAIFTALLLITPWIIFPLFAGMGRPPQNIRGWLDLEGEQHTRFNLLILGGILAYLGTALLYQLLQHKEKLFATLGLALITLAIPLFLINMAYWGSFLSASFQTFQNIEPSGLVSCFSGTIPGDQHSRGVNDLPGHCHVCNSPGQFRVP